MASVNRESGPPPGVIIRLTGHAGEKTIANGNTWEESIVDPTVTVKTKALSALVASAGKAISKRRNSLPVLDCVLVTIEPRQLVLRATDLEITIEDRISTGLNEVTGALAVDWKWLRDTLRQLPPAADLKIELKPGRPETRDEAGVHSASMPRLVLSGDGSTFELEAFEAEEFPPLAEFKPHHEVKIETASFVKALREVAECSSRDTARPLLTGISLQLNESRLELATTDSHVLATRQLPVETNGNGPFKVVVPAAWLNLPYAGETVTIELSQGVQYNSIDKELTPNHARLTMGSVVIDSRLLDGRYPNYVHVIPTTVRPSLQVRRTDLIAALKRVAAGRNADTDMVKLAATPGGVVVSAGNVTRGGLASHHFTGHITPGNGDPEYTGEIEVITAFSASLMLRALSGFDAEELHLHIKDPLTPIVIRAELGSEDRTVVMPMRVK